MILYAEVTTWCTRATLYTFWLTGMVGGNLIQKTDGLQGFWPRCLLLICGGIFMNVILMGLPKIKMSSDNSSFNTLDSYNITPFQTLLFLLQGPKSKTIIRNIACLSGKKKVLKSEDGSKLMIKDAQPPNRKEEIVNIIAAIFSIIMVLFAPIIMFFIDNTTHGLLDGAPNFFVSDLMKYFSLLVVGNYIFRFTARPSSYTDNSVRFFSKELKDFYGFSVYTSPLVSYLKNSSVCIALADPQGKIFIDSDYSNNSNYLDYLIAHEAGHLSDKTSYLINILISPILFPWVVFILLAVGSYSMTFDLITSNLLKAIGLISIYLIIAVWPKFIKQAEYRADDFAIELIGFSAVIKALEELSLSYRTTTKLGYFRDLSFESRLERIRNK